MRACQGLGEHLQWGQPSVCYPWSCVQTIGDPIELGLAEHAEVGALGHVLAKRAVGVLARASLPGAVRVAEVDLHAGLCTQIGVAGHLLALVIGEAFAQRRCNRIQRGRKARQRRGRSGIGHLGQQHQAARPLDQHTHRGLVACTLDEVTFPVARHHAVIHLGQAHVDADHGWDLRCLIHVHTLRWWVLHFTFEAAW